MIAGNRYRLPPKKNVAGLRVTLPLPRNLRQGVYVVLDKRQPQHVMISPTTKRLRDIQGCNYFSRGHPEQEIASSRFQPKSSLYHLRHAVPKLCSLGASKQFRFLLFNNWQWRENRANQLLSLTFRLLSGPFEKRHFNVVEHLC